MSEKDVLTAEEWNKLSFRKRVFRLPIKEYCVYCNKEIRILREVDWPWFCSAECRSKYLEKHPKRKGKFEIWIDSLKEQEKWKCTYCNMINDWNDKLCYHCGSPRRAKERVET